VVQKALDNLMKGKTVIVIAHRLTTIHNADNIMVVNDGRIVEQGRHEQLINLENGAYAALYKAQFKK
jgi:subfamily B ATP-binding cassette protein MsbA